MASSSLAVCATLFAYLTLVLSQTTGYEFVNNSFALVSQFKSRPDLLAPFLNITLHDDASVTPGYIFLAPYQAQQNSIYMYDNRGNLVWSGFGHTGGGPSHNFHVCPINGVDMLCYFTGWQDLGYARGHGVIMDDKLNAVASVQSQGGLAPSDQHEMNVVDGGKSVLLTIYQPTQYDMTPWGITGGMGWILNSYFQEVEIATGELLFEWDALSHIPIDLTYVLPNTTDVSGTGFAPLNPPDAVNDDIAPWDYFHINSIDKNSDGDYLVSGRHVSTIYKISGRDGSIIWQCGGSASDFTFEPGFNFSFQHDARWVVDNATTTILSIFDNASDGFNQSSRYSSGVIFKIDHAAKHASPLQHFIAPYEQISSSQGNTQIFDLTKWETSNVFVSWGPRAYISEYTADGKMVQMGFFATSDAMGYRAFKFNYTTNPTDAPAAYVYAHSTSASTVYYMSWNGATQAAQWRIYASASSSGPWTVLATVPKNGFETIYTASGFHQWALIESLDASGRALKNTTRSVKTFVPGQTLAKVCSADGCPVAQGYAPGSQGDGSRSPGAATPTPTKRSMAVTSRLSALLWRIKDFVVVGGLLGITVFVITCI